MDDPLSATGPAAQHYREDTRLEERFGTNNDAAPAICRICRGEGTQAEPLFYPCKCSGSIKFVHQDCLMEWLSHSQKKYCELCKTPFRFTKLYAPDMPQSLPVGIFIQHMAKYLFRNLLVWLRAAVAISVWVVWLPYFMRAVWSFMFWISDEGLGSSSILARNETDITASELSSSILTIGTCPTSPLLAATTTSAVEVEAVVGQLAGEDLSDFLVRILLNSFTSPLLSPEDTPIVSQNMSAVSGANQTVAKSTLLGGVSLFGNITRSATLNRAIVSVLEGQIITVLVIVSFILVILVRDYVVQQQPEINMMRAAFAEPEIDFPPPRVEAPQPDNAEDVDDVGESGSDGEALADSDQAGERDWQTASTEQQAAVDEQEADGESLAQSMDGGVPPSDEELLPFDNLRSQPQLSENENVKLNVDNRASVLDYLRIYRRADGDMEEIVRIVEEEGLQDELSYWVDVTRRSITRNDDQKGALFPENEHEAEDDSENGANYPIPNGKGKERESPPATPNADPSTSAYAPRQHAISRPRSLSEGPQNQHPTNPLANNSWTFDALPVDDIPNEPSPGFNMPVDKQATTADPFADRGKSDHVAIADGQLLDKSSHQDEMSLGANGSNPTPILPLEPPLVDERNGIEEPAAIQEIPDAGLVGRVADFMWGNLNHPPPVEAAVDRAAGDDDDHEDMWVDVPAGPGADDDEGAGDGEGGAGNAGFDAEAIEDLEDFEGVMELVGMRGPIAGLFQNAVFCAVLVSVTIFACIFLPYNIGRISVWILASPMRLVRILFELSKLLQDVTVLIGGFTSWCALNIADMFATILGGTIRSQVVSARKMAWGFWTSAGSRVMGYILMDFPVSASEIQNFSAISHDALNTVKGNVISTFSKVDATFGVVRTGGLKKLVAAAAALTNSTRDTSLQISSLLLTPSSWVIDLSEPEQRSVIDPELAHWSSLDRFWAIFAGYITLFLLGALYLKRGSPFSRGTVMHAWEAGIIDTLQQASGIMKVILIISIEMLVFPLYCGLLLDAALLPLFEGATFKSRMLFTYNYPMTSIFVHWFVGTGYMFHFALFVSMCRKIMRPGVLYFIRDPDDPEFHPVRDVLERNLTTQLRKILFSAFVYGALVIVCLGGVVWGLAFAVPGVLPVHYSSNEPVLEFPVDLLFYNFLMPLAVKFFKPSDALHTMYTWWFRKCARALRMTFFLFGERRIDEEGSLHLLPGSPNSQIPHIGFLLEVSENNQVIPKTWRDTFEGGDAKPNPHLSREEKKALRHNKAELVKSGQLTKDGRFVRAPASDRVKIPKGKQVFLTVSERDHRKDGHANDDIYASDQYQMVYVPPNFRTRVFLFILFIWIFAAVTGVGFTIIPLVIGRKVFKELIPDYVRTNDIYALSIGIFLMGSFAYTAFHMQGMKARVGDWIRQAKHDVFEGNTVGRVTAIVLRVAKLIYAYFFLLVVFPLLTSAMMELYVTLPLHTYMYPPTALSTQQGQDVSRHTVRVIQAWTLGLLYMKLGSRMITTIFPDSRAATAVRSLLRRGWLQPDVSLLTRAFIIPGVAAATVAIFGPPAVASFVLKQGSLGTAASNEVAEAVRQAVIYRQSYPAAAMAAILANFTFGLVKVLNRWTAGVRDEAYLIGERLHNFGTGATGGKKARTWRQAGRARL